MKKTAVSFFSVVLLLFFASSIQAQNQSAENSDVIVSNIWLHFNAYVICPEVGKITFSGEVQELIKSLPDGTVTYHFNAIGEGTDEFGGEWRWHDVWSEWIPADYPDDFHLNRTVILMGPKGAKFKLKALWIIRDGEIIQSKFEADC